MPFSYEAPITTLRSAKLMLAVNTINKHKETITPYLYQPTMTTTATKSKLGQFYTTNYEYILQGFSVPTDIPIVEPFAGNGDLLAFVKSSNHAFECYDIDPRKDYIIQRDTLLYPPSFSGKFVFTNPPYLAKNKSADKAVYELYGCDDLYKCFIELLTRDVCEGGVLIVPLNFISSIRAGDTALRRRFVSAYRLDRIHIFEEQVFQDTTYTVCSIRFSRIGRDEPSTPTICTIFPNKKQIAFALTEQNHYTIGGEIFTLPATTAYKIERATKDTKKTDCITNILVKCIDDNIRSKIQLRLTSDQDRYIDTTPNLTERSYATLVIDPPLSLAQQTELVERFNRLLEEYREKYNSLFLTNYRESNTIARKRISFGLVFQLCGYLLGESSSSA